MKGIVLTTFNEMVENEIGIDMWEAILESVNPESQGIYTSVEDFPDEELLAMVSELSERTDLFSARSPPFASSQVRESLFAAITTLSWPTWPLTRRLLPLFSCRWQA